MKSILVLLLSLLALCGSLQAQERKVADRFYWMAVGTAAGVGMADTAYSKHWRAQDQRRYEGNPLLGQHPSWARALATGVAFHGAAAYTSYEMKKRGWKFWWLPQAALVGAHIYGLVSTNRDCQRINPTFPNFCH